MLQHLVTSCPRLNSGHQLGMASSNFGNPGEIHESLFIQGILGIKLQCPFLDKSNSPFSYMLMFVNLKP